jgi:5-methylthioadenosine/S-adenosylhomocysteine deaminase
MAQQIHAAQSVSEFHEITRRHSYMPISWLNHLGLLSERPIIGHGIFLDDHPSTRWHTETDLRHLAETGTTVTNCPTVFARRGITLKNTGVTCARALGRSDIGRIAARCRADLGLVDATHPMMGPPLDPMRNSICPAGNRALRAMFVDGRQVVDNGRVLTIGRRAAAEARIRAKANVSRLEWRGRTAEAISPRTVPDA